MNRTTPMEYIEVEREYSGSTLCIYTYKFARDSGRMHILEYVDISTGEIIPKQDLHIPEIRPEAMLERFTRLDKLRPEVRDFAVFLLRFRNQACGFLVPMDTLVQWYSDLTGKQTFHIERYFESLYKHKILSDRETPEREFMVLNPKRNKKQAKGDYDRACTLYNIMMLDTLSTS